MAILFSDEENLCWNQEYSSNVQDIKIQFRDEELSNDAESLGNTDSEIALNILPVANVVQMFGKFMTVSSSCSYNVLIYGMQFRECS